MTESDSFRPTYSPKHKEDHYFTLLKLARISGWRHDDVTAPDRPIEENRYYQALLDLPVLQYRFTRIYALIYQNTVKLKLFDHLPIEIQSNLKRLAQQTITKSQSIQITLDKLVNELTGKNIPLILLKGTGYANTLYTSETPRLATDIDFLVRGSDFELASNLIARTMTPMNPVPRESPHYKTIHERPYKPTTGAGPAVDLHRQLTTHHLYANNENTHWSQSKAHPVYADKYGDKVRLLSPEHELLFQAVNAHKGMDFARHNLLDSHEILNQTAIDPDKLLSEARLWGAKHVLFLLLNNCMQCMGTSILPELLDKLRPSAFKSHIIRSVLSSSRVTPQKGKPISYRLLQIVGQLALPDKLTQGLTFQYHYLQARLLR